MLTIYLLHFDRPYVHACHYLGITNDIKRRLQEHRSGNASSLTCAVSSAGIGWQVVRTWQAKIYGDEHTLKRRKNSPQLCPICNPCSWQRNGCLKESRNG